MSEAKIDITNINLGGATTTTTTAATSTKSEFTMAAPTGANEYTLTVEYLDANGKSNKVDIKYTAGADQKTTGEAVKAALEGNSEISSVFDVAVDVSGKLTLTSKATGADGAGADSFVTATGGAQGIADGDTLTLNGRTYEFVKDTSTAPKKDGAIAVVLGADDAASVANLKKALEGTGVSVEINNTNDLKFTADKNGSALTLQIGDTSESWNQLKVTINDCHTTALGIADLNISNQSDAASALDVIKNAINYVSDVRGTLGATQNRLDHTINNLSVMEENIQDAESTIRDTDVADEMMAYTKNNILIQSAQAMLAQANQVPQGVLQLLQ